MKEVTRLEDILFNVVRPNKEGELRGLFNSYYVIDLVKPAQLNRIDNLVVIKKKLINYGFDVKKLKYDQASDFYWYSKYLNCNNDQQLYNYFRKIISQMNKVILESIKQVY